MNASNKVILESPLVVPDIVDIYRRIILAVPDMNELVHLALLEAQYLGTSQGKSAMVAVGEFCEHLNPDVLREYASLTNLNIATVRSLFENDILNGELYNVVSYGNGENEFLGMNVGWYVQRDNFESWCELNDLEMYEVTGNILDNI